MYKSGPSIPLETKCSNCLPVATPARFPWKQASQTHALFHQQGVVRLVGLEEQTGTWRRFFPVEIRLKLTTVNEAESV